VVEKHLTEKAVDRPRRAFAMGDWVFVVLFCFSGAMGVRSCMEERSICMMRGKEARRERGLSGGNGPGTRGTVR
jgi:hypothetical protein